MSAGQDQSCPCVQVKASSPLCTGRGLGWYMVSRREDNGRLREDVGGERVGGVGGAGDRVVLCRLVTFDRYPESEIMCRACPFLTVYWVVEMIICWTYFGSLFAGGTVVWRSGVCAALTEIIHVYIRLTQRSFGAAACRERN